MDGNCKEGKEDKPFDIVEVEFALVGIAPRNMEDVSILEAGTVFEGLAAVLRIISKEGIYLVIKKKFIIVSELSNHYLYDEHLH
jgi:hypothetical protein